MTKAEELKILEAIEGLILEAGPDSYIGLTFAGIVDVCKRNIEDDFGNCPVEDLRLERERNAEMMKANAEHGKVLLAVEHERDCLRSQLEAKDAEIEKLGHMVESWKKTADEWEQNALDVGEMYCNLEKECAQKDLEIRNLKAEIVRMKLERMTDVEYAELYESMRKECE